MSREQAKEVLTIESDGILAVRDRLGEEFDQAIDIIMACPSRLIITGIGKSGLIGQKIAATLNSTGTPSFFLHPVEAMHGDLGLVTATDVVLAISYSGETAELKHLLSSLQKRGITIIALSGGKNSTLGNFATVTLDATVPQEACPLGLAPTASTTAALALGDALAVTLLNLKKFKVEDFRRNHPGGSLGERLKVAVSEVMLTGHNIARVGDDCSLEDAVRELNDKSIGAVMVTDGRHQLKGIITDGDIRRLISAGRNFQDTVMEEIMTVDPVTISGETMAADALSLMQRREITVLAVVDSSGVLHGILHLHDLLGKGEFRFLI